MISHRFCDLLLKKGHKVFILSRNSSNKSNIFKWDIENNYIDETHDKVLRIPLELSQNVHL